MIKQQRLVVYIIILLCGLLFSASLTLAAPTEGVSSQGQIKNKINFNGVALKEALRSLAEMADLNMITDNSTVSGTVTAHLRDISALEAFKLIIKSHGLDYKIIGNTIIIGTEEKLRNGFGKEVTKVFKMKNSKPAEIKKSLNLLVDAESIRVDKRTKSLVITTYQSKLPVLRNTIKELDREKDQVIIQARVEEISRGGLKELGIDWNFQQLTINGNSAEVNDQEEDDNTVGADSNLSVRDDISLNYLSVINMLEKNDQATNLANPQITTVDGKDATIDIGNQVPIVKPGGDGETEVEFKDVGISLDITPQITEDNKIYMDVKPETSIVSEYFETADGIRYPIIETRKVETNVRVVSGETIAIGGLITEDEIENMSKVPFLGDLPILEKVFSSKSTETQKTELIVFLTPRIIKDSGAQKDKKEGIIAANYQVQKEDTLWGISQLFNLSFYKIISYNNTEMIESLKPGTELKIPLPKNYYYAVKEGDSLEEIAVEYNLSKQRIQKINNINSLQGMDKLILPLVVKKEDRIY